ncbi:MAG: hypothetical protein ABIN57_05755 [Chitinophagaceae bacterium]
MAGYLSDREFTDHVHLHHALPKIYSKIGWQLIDVAKDQALHQDLNEGIDYTFKNADGKIITVQERFREKKYAQFSDATLRFRRANHPNENRIESEFYKIKADYLVYGVMDGDKNNIASINGFIKGVILNIPFLQEKYKIGELLIGSTGTVRCQRKGNTMICPEILNKDGSSSFLPFDICMIKSLWTSGAVLHQKGYY